VSPGRRLRNALLSAWDSVASLPPWAGLAAAAVGVAIVVVVATDPFGGDGRPSPAAPTAAPTGEGEQAKASASLGFPAFATKNTTRVGGADAATNAAGAALAVFPGGEQRPEAVALVPEGNWHAGVAAAVLMAPPVRAPLLVSGPDGVPEATSQAVAVLQPTGGDASERKQAFSVAGAAVPEGLRSATVAGADPAGLAAGVDRLRATLADSPEPEHLLIVGEEGPGYAVPAAAWAARSGDPVFFTRRDTVPAATATALKAHRGVPAYLLGPETVVSRAAFKRLRKLAPTLQRVAGPDPVANAIAFAKYQDGTFGWNINDPGHGMVIANSARPLDAAAAAPLSAAGKYGPLLLTDSTDKLPAVLRSYLLDIKPGYEDDPTRAFYNHAWLIGDASAIGVGVQGQIDALLELTPVGQARAPTQVKPAPQPKAAPKPAPAKPGKPTRPAKPAP
jgi:hypothetical protein